MVRKLAVVLVLALCLTPDPAVALDPSRAISQFHHTAWSTEQGVPADVWAIDQTPDGYLWLGSVNGLYRFDGIRFDPVAADLLPSPSIHSLVATPTGGLWIGYERPIGVISLLEHGVVHNFPVDAPSSTSVHKIMLGPRGSVWAATPDYILRFDGKRFRAVGSDWGTSLGESSGGVWAFGVARDGVVWSRNRNGLFYLKPGQSHFERAESYVGGVASFAATRDGRLWTTDSAAGHLYVLPEMSSQNDVPKPTPGIPLSVAVRGAILLDRDASLWFTSASGGGLRRARSADAQQSPDRFTAEDGLSSDVVHTLFEDREGSVWVGTNLGLDRFRPANVVTEARIPSGFRARFVRATRGGIYAYTGWSNTAARTHDASESLYRILPGQPPQLLVANVGRLRDMVVDESSGEIWLSTGLGPQQLLGNRVAPPIPVPPEVVGSIYSAALDADGSLWISAFRHGVFRRAGSVWKSISLPPMGATAVLTPNPGGGMWIRYAGGVLLLARGEAIRDFSSKIPPIGDLTFMKVDGDGLWLGGEAGLAYFDGTDFRWLTSKAVPALTVVTGVDTTSNGSTWVFTQSGILRFDTASLQAGLRSGSASGSAEKLKYEAIGPRDGLPGAPYGGVYGSTVATGPDGKVWFTTGEGLVWIDPQNVHTNPVPPPVSIRSVKVNDRLIDHSQDKLKLPPGAANVQIDYTALSLVTPERNQFRYRLEGVDTSWVDAGDRRQAFYTKLSPGTYQFRVIASNNDGVWNSEGAGFRFTVPPTFMQSKWFLLLCAALGGTLLWLLYMLRLRQVAGRIRDRLEERLAERERIARDLHDTLLQGFHGLMLRFQTVADQISPGQPAHQQMHDALERADEVLVAGRDRVRNLRPTRRSADLSEALADAVKDVSWGSTAKVRVITEGKARPLHPLVLCELLEIGREALSNACRHAAADNIEATVTYGRRALQMRIRDDGVGIDPNVSHGQGREGHFGLAGMRERTRKIRSKLTLASRPGVGTDVLVEIPAKIAYATRLHGMHWLRESAED
ncbi:MAG: two-component regulator propeller domain-containing protein [Steroidobacteraceae bacterium]